VIDRVEELRINAERARYRAKAANVLRVSPRGVVAAAIAAGNEGGPHFGGTVGRAAILPDAGGGP
jgi:hypothetical protein